MRATDAAPADRRAAPAGIMVRRPHFDFADLPQWWVGGSAVATHWGNAGHVFIPLGEQFFIDTVRELRADIGDPELADDVRAFIGQESVHTRAHEALWDVLRERGVPVDAYAGLIGSLRSLERHLPLTFRLSVTAALEHYTAAFGESFLVEDLADAVPDEMARMLAWHGLEELEHRSVAFDVLRIAGGGYPMRVAGLAFATALLAIVPGIGVVMFAAAKGTPVRCEGPDRSGANRGLSAMSARLLRRMSGHVVDYLRPGFHPSDIVVPAEAGGWSEHLSRACAEP